MSDPMPQRRSGGRDARRAARLAAHLERTPFLTRTMAPFEVLSDEGLATIEHNADTILEEVGIEFRGDPDALRLLREGGADVDGERVRFPRGMCRSIVQASAPRQFTQHARNPANSVEVGGPHTVFVPNYGSPFVRDLDRGRRYGTLQDFQDFVKLAYLSPHLHHSGGTVCEPVDVPVNKRHLDMVYAHMRYSDKPFMGSVTAPERAQDTVDMARILFGAEYLEDHCVVLSLINANSPLVWDSVMIGAARAYAQANQATMMTPFILAGAMAPVTAAGVAAQTLAESLAGMTFVQLTRPGAPVVLGSFASSMSMQSGAPTFGTPEPALVLYTMAALARRLGVPFRSGGSLTASKVADAQAAYESAATLIPTVLAGVNFVLHAAGWLEGGLSIGYEKFIMDADQLGMMGVFVRGVDMSENGQALDAIRANGPGQHFLGTAHTLANFETAFYRSEIADNNSFEQWQEDGSLGGAAREHHLEADAPRVRGAADGRRDRRGAARVHRAPQGIDAGFGGLMVSLLGRRRGLDEASRTALRAALEDPIFELLPLKNLPDQIPHLPGGARVSVTASPNKGIDATLDWATQLQADGFRAIPHLSARMIPDRAKLAELLGRAREAGLTQGFVVGGDADEPGEYLDGLSLLGAMQELGHPFETLGCPGYPNGHADIPDAALEQALRDKAPFVEHVTSQMDFDTKLIAAWVRRLRAERLEPDIVIGVPGVADPQKLLNVAARIGVKDAKRFLVKNLRFVTGMARSGGFYKPTGFVEALAPLLADPSARVTGFHIYTFNAVEATETWRQGMLEDLAA
jgi:trimethylamine---corrinoid protein Co-methyltransferase